MSSRGRHDSHSRSRGRSKSRSRSRSRSRDRSRREKGRSDRTREREGREEGRDRDGGRDGRDRDGGRDGGEHGGREGASGSKEPSNERSSEHSNTGEGASKEGGATGAVGEVKRERRRKSRFDDGPPVLPAVMNGMAPGKWDQPAPLFAAAPLAPVGFVPTNYQQVTTKTIAVPLTVVGSLIGKGGSVISQLMQQSGGCKIQMQQKDDMAPDAKQRGVSLTGTLAQVTEAERLVAGVVAQALAGGISGAGPGNATIAVPASSVGSIIGRSGSVIQKLIADTGCQIKIQQKDENRGGKIERDVSLIGNASQIAHATKLIYDIVADPSSTGGAGPPPGPSGGGFFGGMSGAPPQPGMGFRPPFPPQGPTKRVIMVRDTDVGSLIGHKGSVIKQLIADSGCQIQIQPKNDSGPPTLNREVSLTGTPEQVEKAVRLITDLTSNPPSNPGGPPPPSFPSAPPPYNPYGGPPLGLPIYSPYGPPHQGSPLPYNPYGLPPSWPPGVGPPPGAFPPGWQPPPFNPYGIAGLGPPPQTQPPTETPPTPSP